MTTVATLCLAVLALCLIPCGVRLARADTSVDRLLAFDLIGVLVALMAAVYAVVSGTWVYVEISMGLAVLSLVGTVAVAHYIERKSVF